MTPTHSPAPWAGWETAQPGGPALTPQEALQAARAVANELAGADPLTFDHAKAARLLNALLDDLAHYVG